MNMFCSMAPSLIFFFFLLAWCMYKTEYIYISGFPCGRTLCISEACFLAVSIIFSQEISRICSLILFWMYIVLFHRLLVLFIQDAENWFFSWSQIIDIVLPLCKLLVGFGDRGPFKDNNAEAFFHNSGKFGL